ncbi:uncharacterized protein BKA78DRAFT_6595 [Phyllosticta capitalensis]|uniref:uncharacterized protein n=1 Tax=Phyllosticta capitalensis TaxID=121624 RepID=UPI00312DEF2A
MDSGRSQQRAPAREGVSSRAKVACLMWFPDRSCCRWDVLAGWSSTTALVRHLHGPSSQPVHCIRVARFLFDSNMNGGDSGGGEWEFCVQLSQRHCPEWSSARTAAVVTREERSIPSGQMHCSARLLCDSACFHRRRCPERLVRANPRPRPRIRHPTSACRLFSTRQKAPITDTATLPLPRDVRKGPRRGSVTERRVAASLPGNMARIPRARWKQPQTDKP